MYFCVQPRYLRWLLKSPVIPVLYQPRVKSHPVKQWDFVTTSGLSLSAVSSLHNHLFFVMKETFPTAFSTTWQLLFCQIKVPGNARSLSTSRRALHIQDTQLALARLVAMDDADSLFFSAFGTNTLSRTSLTGSHSVSWSFRCQRNASFRKAQNECLLMI